MDERFGIDRPIPECDFIRYVLLSTATINETNSQIFFDTPSEDSAVSLKDSYLDLGFELFITAGKRSADAQGISLKKLGPIVLFSENKSTTGSENQLEIISNAHLFVYCKKY